MSPNTSMEPLNRFEGSAENSIETVSDQSVPVNLVSPPAAESCHAQTTDEVAPFAIEFCCGTAGLTAQLRKFGLRQSHGVDHIIKAGAKAPVCKLDLTDPASEALAKSWLLHPLCKYAHFGIPCGTCSRAREIPLGPDAPRPLRSDDYPEGLENLTSAERKRVDAANAVYAACCRLIICCITNAIRWSLEQPHRSIFWLTKYWKQVLQHCQPIFTSFHACMHGGQRPKQTTIASDVPELMELEATCDGQHAHLPWGRTEKGYATAEETEYPFELCRRWARIIADIILQDHRPRPSVLLAHPDKKARALANKQTKKSLTFMPEFHFVEAYSAKSSPNFQVGDKIRQEQTHEEHVLPKYSRILRITQLNKTGGEAEQHDSDGTQPSFQVAYGVPWSEESFIQEAIARGHPSNICGELAPLMMKAIEDNVNKSAEEIIMARASWLKKWIQRAKDLDVEEKGLHSAMPPHRRKILEGKRILLLKEIIRDMQYPDPEIADLIANGFDLIGTCGGGNVLPQDFQPATLTAQDLELHSESSNKAIIFSTKSSGDESVNQELWKKTQEEVEKCWLKKLHSLPQDGRRVSRRFAVVQSDKVRPIDNYSESQVNDAATIVSKCTVDGTDCIAGMVATYMRKAQDAGKSPRLLGRSFDLKSAYRQLAVADSSLKWARLAVFCPDDRQTHCFQQFSLPFGAKASVVAFLRCARLIQWLGLQLSLMVTCYFDDYVCVSSPQLSKNSEMTFETILELLGWKYDKSGDKADSMTSEVSALGVQLDLSRTGNGVLLVSNTEKRKDDLCRLMGETLARGTLTSSEAASLRGRLGFAEGQLFGRAIRKLINVLGSHVLQPQAKKNLPEATKIALERVAERISGAAPRMVDTQTNEVYFMFTDACFDSETKSGGIGGVLIGPTGSVVSWFSSVVDRHLCNSFMDENQEQAIGELEAFAVYVGLKLWSKTLSSKHVVCFVDNEGARYLILRGYSGNKTLDRIVHGVSLIEEDHCIFSWYARVPSEANVADHPSRSVESDMLPPTLRVEVQDLEDLLRSAGEVCSPFGKSGGVAAKGPA